MVELSFIKPSQKYTFFLRCANKIALWCIFCLYDALRQYKTLGKE